MATPLFKLKLFVRSGDSGAALSRVYKALEFHKYTDYELEIIDLQNPKAQFREREVPPTTPALVLIKANGEIIVATELDDIDMTRQLLGFKGSK